MHRTLSCSLYKKHMKKLRNDVILISSILIITVISAFLYFSMQKGGNNVAVIKNGEQIAVCSLKENLTLPITDDNHTNMLVIKDGKAYISQANCPDKICVNHRPVSKTGETIVCLPAKLVIEIIN